MNTTHELVLTESRTMRAQAIGSDVVPGKSADGAFIYALRFSSGVLKVGYTADPSRRIRQHADSAKQHGGKILRRWVSLPHAAAQENERRLIAFCAEQAPRVTGNGKAGEYFTRLDFDDVLAFARTLSYEPARPPDAQSEERAKQRAAQLWQSLQNAFGRRLALPHRPRIPADWSRRSEADMDLASQILKLPREIVEAFDAEDWLIVNENLMDGFHAAREIEALERFLAKARERRDIALSDARYALSDALAAKHGGFGVPLDGESGGAA